MAPSVRATDPLVLIRRILANVDDVDGCWIWRGATARGYGKVWAGRRSPAGNYVADHVHRVVYELLREPIPDGLVLDHRCRRTRCCNPDHLEPVTSQENVRRGFARITRCKSGHPFTPENTRRTTEGRRACRACGRRWAREAYQRRRSAA